MFDLISLVENHPWEMAFAAAMFGATVAIAWFFTATIGRRARKDVREQHHRLEAALNNMKQGLCMFDAQDRVVIWNRRYLDMYGIKPDQIWAGCDLQQVLETRRAAGTFSGDIGEYASDIPSGLEREGSFTKVTELADGRSVALVNQSMPGGGWVA